MKEKVYLPLYLKKYAEQFAKDWTWIIDNLEPSDKGYKKAYDKAYYTFCNDYYESLTGIESNPTSAKAREAFEVFLPDVFTGEKAAFKQYIQSEEHEKMLQQRLKSSIMGLAHIYLTLIGEYDIKEADERVAESMKYRQKLAGEARLSPDALRSVAAFRLKRSYIVMGLLASIIPVFRISGKALDTVVNQIINDTPSEDLNKKSFRNMFASKLTPILTDIFKSVSVIKPTWEQIKAGLFKKIS